MGRLNDVGRLIKRQLAGESECCHLCTAEG